MSNTIQTKRCSKCKQIKPISEFHKESANKDGHNRWCKKCRYIYDKSEKKNIYNKKYRKTNNYKIAYTKYNNSEKGRKKHKEYYSSKIGKGIHKKNSKAYYNRNKIKCRARIIIGFYIRKNMLSRPNAYHCRICWNQAEEYHHHRGYKQEHHLDIIPLCRKCHLATHKSIRVKSNRIVA